MTLKAYAALDHKYADSTFPDLLTINHECIILHKNPFHFKKSKEIVFHSIMQQCSKGGLLVILNYTYGQASLNYLLSYYKNHQSEHNIPLNLK